MSLCWRGGWQVAIGNDPQPQQVRSPETGRLLCTMRSVTRHLEKKRVVLAEQQVSNAPAGAAAAAADEAVSREPQQSAPPPAEPLPDAPEPEPEPEVEPAEPRTQADICIDVVQALEAADAELGATVDLLLLQTGTSSAAAALVAVHRGQTWAAVPSLSDSPRADVRSVRLAARSWEKMEADASRLTDWLRGGWCWSAVETNSGHPAADLASTAADAAARDNVVWARDEAARTKLSALRAEIAQAVAEVAEAAAAAGPT